MRILFSFFFFLVLSLGAVAQSTVLLTLSNINDNQGISDVVVDVAAGDTTLVQYVGEEDLLNFTLAPGEYTLVLKADDPFTPGKDYYKQQPITVEQSLIQGISLFPVGTLRGMVKDTFGNVVGNASLRFECTTDIGAGFPERTNAFGFFMVDHLPIGSCKVFAGFAQGVGLSEVNINQGELLDTEIVLDTTILTPSTTSKGGLLLVLLVLGAAGVVWWLRKRPRHKPHPSLPQKTEKELRKRATDILKTLNKREKEVVQFLLDNKHKANQAALRHHTGIPRTSLSRIFTSLEAKNIIQVKRVGKVVKVSLTSWFLEKE